MIGFTARDARAGKALAQFRRRQAHLGQRKLSAKSGSKTA
jgi:hypothetical protein